MLRVYDTTGGSSSYFDVPVYPSSKSWYIHLWTPERCYCAELGVSQEDGGFTSLARSNTIQTPRAWPAAAIPAADPAGAGPAITMPEAIPGEIASEERAPAAQAPQVPVPKPAQPPLAPAPHSGIVETSDQYEVAVPATPPPIEEPSQPREAPVSEAPRVLEPLDAAKLLRARLEAIYASLQWMSRPREAPISPGPPAPEASPAPEPAGPNPPHDLTQEAEDHFSTGVSSNISKPPD